MRIRPATSSGTPAFTEGQLTCEQKKAGDSQCVLIRIASRALLPDFGSHIGGRTSPGRVQMRYISIDGRSHTEIAEQGVRTHIQDVRRFDITVYHALRVRVVQCLPNFFCNGDDALERPGAFAFALKDFCQRPLLGIWQYEIRLAL